MSGGDIFMSNLNRFIEAQKEAYPRALSEIKNGMKRTHWMWYIFPQICGLGESATSTYYAISDLDEARAYLEDEVLGERLKDISSELLRLETRDPILVFGWVDALKLNSSMTLFNYVSKSSSDSVFQKVIDKYFDGRKDETTLKICQEIQNKSFMKK